MHSDYVFSASEIFSLHTRFKMVTKFQGNLIKLCLLSAMACSVSGFFVSESSHIYRLSPLQARNEANPIAGPDLPPIGATTKRLFLVRHGEVINPGGDKPVFYGALDVPLSPLGEAEAKAAAQYLEQFDLQYVVSSPLSRAIFGANEVLALQKNLLYGGVMILDGFKELDRGAWCGLTADEIGKEKLARFDACDESVTPGDGGESYSVLKKRVIDARNHVLERLSDGCSAAIVSHLQVTRSMLSDALNIPINEMSGLKVLTASLTCIDFDMTTGEQTVHFQSFKPEVGLAKSNEGVYN